jgi:pyridoxal 5'-phosphate synthase pdxT subunit
MRINGPVGILALQGAFQKHADSLAALGVESRLVKQARDLDGCSGLIMPGGESTTMSLLVQSYGLYDVLREFATDRPVMGVCAGLIMMAHEVDDARVTPLDLMPFKALRNHYGRQVHSFSTNVHVTLADGDADFPAVFIRAPGITDIAPGVKILARHDNEVVMIESGKHLALAFHPELTGDTRIHEYWLRKF